MAFRKVNEFKECTLHYDAPGGGLFYLYTDMPGGVMALRKTEVLPATTGRGTHTIPLDGIEGTLYRPEVIPPPVNVLRLFAGVLFVRPIGVYLNGADGEKWTTQELALGV